MHTFSFQEKRHGLELAGLLLAVGWYLLHALPDGGAGDRIRLPQLLGLATAMGLWLVLQVAGQALLAWRRRGVASDERDRSIALVGARNEGWVLSFTVGAGLWVALTGPSGNFWLVHVLLGGWVLGAAVRLASQLWLYRHGFV